MLLMLLKEESEFGDFLTLKDTTICVLEY